MIENRQKKSQKNSVKIKARIPKAKGIQNHGGSYSYRYSKKMQDLAKLSRVHLLEILKMNF